MKKSLKLLSLLLAACMLLTGLSVEIPIKANAATFTTTINGTTRTFNEGTNVGGHYSAGCIVEAGKTTWTSSNHDSGHYCCWNNATEIYKSWWGSTPDHHYDNFLWVVPETPNTTENMKKWLSVSEPGSRVTIGNTYGSHNGHTVIYLGVDPSDSNYMWIINTNGHGYGLNPVERVSWSYLPTYLSSSYGKIICIEWPGAASEYEKRMTPHHHSYFEHYEAAHPHKIYMQCSQSSCGDIYYTGANAGTLSNHFEDAHPHKEYTSCSLCSYKNYTGKTRTVAGCLDCERPTSAAVSRTVFNGHIYEVYKGKTTWDNAKKYAEEMGGHLATITSVEEEAAIESILPTASYSLWFGASDAEKEGTWKWITGEAFNYSNWNTGEPNNSGSKEHYGGLYCWDGKTGEYKVYRGKWNDYVSYPDDMGGFIVEYEPQLTDMVQGNGHTYEVYKGQTNWAAAKEHAESKGGHLVTITSADEQTTIYQKIVTKFGENLWIGASDAKKEGNWEWVTGESFSYKYWNDSQPDNWEGNEHYAHVYGDTGRWNDVPLSNSSIKGFIVEYDCDHEWKIESVTVEATCTQTGVAVVKCAKCEQTQSVGYRANGDLLDSASYEWTTTPPPPNAVQVEKKTQYRFAKKETTESSASSLSGWQRRTDVTNPVTEYGSWKNENPTTSKPTESDTLRITKSYVSAYNYYHICNNYYDGCWNVDSIPYGSGNHYRHTISVSSPLPAINIADKGGKQFYGGSGSGAPACSSNWYIWIYDGETYTYEYQTRSASTKYFYYRWKDFSDWQDAAVTADDNTKVETRTVYRYYAPQTVEGDHVWDSGKVTKEATCAAEGEKTYTCSVCNATKTESIAKTNDHKMDSGKVTKEPTCKETGVKTFTCSVCKTTSTEPIEKLTVHTWDDGFETKKATLLAEGEMTYTCTVCKTTRKEVIPIEITSTTPVISVGNATAAPGTSVSVDVSIANNPGINTFALGIDYDTSRLALKNVTLNSALGGQFQYAKRAVWLNSNDTKYNGAILSLTFDVSADAEEGDAKVTVTYQPGDISNYNEDDVLFAVSSGTITVGDHVLHTWDAGKVTKAATCTVDGVKTFTCTVCKETKTEVEKAPGHKAVTDKAVAPTCTKDGKTEGSHCSVCGTVLKAQTAINAPGHKWDDGKVTKAATCTINEVKTFTCTVCKETKTETIIGSHHKVVTDEAVAATCTKNGKTEGSHCSVCGAVLKAQTVVKATGHKWNGGKVTKAATCTENGVKTYTCTVCKTTKTETVKATGHKAVTDKAVAATCTKNGKTEGSHCSVCGAVLKAQNVVKATGHKWNGGKVTKAATCTESGVKTYTCTVCKTTKTETVKATGHKTVMDKAVAATCTKNGKTEGSHCSVCGAILKAQTVVKAPGHKWNGGKVTKAATCTENGVKTYTCTVCKTTKTETVKATGHKVVTDKAVTATCTKNGKTEGSHCSVCGAVLKAQTVVKATGHKWDEGRFVSPDRNNLTAIKSYTCTICKQTKTERYRYTLGDVNQDNQITAADARLALRRAVGLETYSVNTPQYLACDVDLNGEISSADARLILRASVGLEDPINWK